MGVRGQPMRWDKWYSTARWARISARTIAGAQSSEARAASRKFRRSIRGEVVGISASWCTITLSATEILRDLRKPQVRQGRPCGGSSHTRTRSAKGTT
jgi:hypothetical protein